MLRKALQIKSFKGLNRNREPSPVLFCEKSFIFFNYLRKIVILYGTNCYLYTSSVAKSPAFLEEKVFHKMRVARHKCKFLEKRRKRWVPAFAGMTEREKALNYIKFF